MHKTFIDFCKEKCLADQVLTQQEICHLLEIPLGSETDNYLRKTAREVAAIITGNQGRVWCAVGMDYTPCTMNCKFCSFGAAWGLIQQERHVSEEEILDRVRHYVAGGASYIILRTTEFYDLDTLLAYIPTIRKAIPGDYAIVLNTGELDEQKAGQIAAAGVYGVYHALRLREGSDTPFSPEERLTTMKNVSKASLTLASLVEPIGPEHSNEEIAERFLQAVRCGAKICGAMARFPVVGTPLGERPMLEVSRLAQIIAVLRLSGGRQVNEICVHPATAETMASGANVLVVEAGAIPRDRHFSAAEWAGVNMTSARQLLRDSGYHVMPLYEGLQKENKKCPCLGANLEKFMQPIILHILKKEPLNGYQTQKRIACYATYQDACPDLAATYRFLRNMESRGLLTCQNKIYAITPAGEECLNNWQQTLQAYTNTLNELLAQLKDEKSL